jgi:hypothetical protein
MLARQLKILIQKFSFINQKAEDVWATVQTVMAQLAGHCASEWRLIILKHLVFTIATENRELHLKEIVQK